MLKKYYKKNFFVFGVLLILFLNFVIAVECGDFICEFEEVDSCPLDCEIVVGEDYVPPEVAPDNSATETILPETSGEMSNEIPEETSLEDNLSEESSTLEQTNLPVDESSFSLNNIFENPFILIGGGVIALIIIVLIVFLLLRKNKSSQEENISQTQKISQQ